MSDKVLDLRLCSYAGKDLHGRVLAGALLEGTDLSGTNLQEAVLTKVGGGGRGAGGRVRAQQPVEQPVEQGVIRVGHAWHERVREGSASGLSWGRGEL